jgi:hypothetical protein
MSGRRYYKSRSGGRGRGGSMRSMSRSYGGNGGYRKFGGGNGGGGGGGQRSFSNNRRRQSSSSSSAGDYHARASCQRLINHH